MELSLLSFDTQFVLRNDPDDVTVIDTTNYGATAVSTPELIQPVINHSQVEGIVKATDPLGDIFHSGVFGGPSDIIRNSTDRITGIELPLDASSKRIKGIYTFLYTIRVTGEIFQFPIVALDQGLKKYYITGDYTAVFADLTATTITDSTGNDGAVTVTDASYNATTGRTEITVSGAIADPTADGLFQVTATRTYSKEVNYNFQYDTPVSDIDMEFSCDKSELTSTDNTDYGTNTITRTHTLKYPRDLASPPADIVTPLQQIKINPIYTNNWTSTISTDMDTIEDGLYILDTVTGTKNINVECDDDICSAYQSMANVQANYEKSLKSSHIDTRAHWAAVHAVINYEWMLYQISRSCGNGKHKTHLDNIISAASANDCYVPSTDGDSKSSVLVVAVSAGGTSTIYNELVNQWFHGTGVPSPAIHSDGDYYVDTNNYNWYYKSSGSWALIGNLKGADGLRGSQIYNGTGAPSGALGENGDYYVENVTGQMYYKSGGVWGTTLIIKGSNGINGTTILAKELTRVNMSGSIPSWSTVTGKTFAIAASALAVGDAIEIIASMQRDDIGSNKGGMRLDFGSGAYVDVGQQWVMGNDTMMMRVLISFLSATQWYIEPIFYQSQNGGKSTIHAFPLSTSRAQITSNTALITTGIDPAAGFGIRLQTTTETISGSYDFYAFIVKRLKS